jgi:hypothetical protein
LGGDEGWDRYHADPHFGHAGRRCRGLGGLLKGEDRELHPSEIAVLHGCTVRQSIMVVLQPEMSTVRQSIFNAAFIARTSTRCSRPDEWQNTPMKKPTVKNQKAI